MGNKIVIFCLVCALIYGCKKENVENSVNFNVTNLTSGIVKELNIQVTDSEKTINVLTISKLGINSKEIKVIDLNPLKFKGDGSYKAVAILADGKKHEKSFGYITNGNDLSTKGYIIEISNNEITIK